ncbi:MAG: penicillin-binding protein 1C [Candidatus Cloacimonadota bacterium]|nr:MAG: penicillin-binding protein 1C [Candidatus Cloacimonadota bacterium]
MKKAILLIIITPFLLFFTFNFFYPLNRFLAFRPSSKIIYSNNFQILHMERSHDGFFRINLGAKNIPKKFIDSLILFEDQYFFYHFGVNPFSIIRALLHNIFFNKRIGASTISMQVARMIEKRERSYHSKIIECFRAIQLELLFSKSEILSIYLNIAPYGGNIEGIHTASQFYFNKHIDKLSFSEFGYLMVLPKNPEKYKPSKSMFKAINIRNKFYKKTFLREKFNKLKNEKIFAKRHSRIALLPHYSNYLKNETVTFSKIDIDLQKIIQYKLKKTIETHNNKGINNGACIVYDHINKKVIVWLGSQNFHDKKSFGQNDGVLAKRSPGSTLKPLIYAAAIDEGLISPKQLLLDIPMQYQNYTPKNFDSKFYGLVSVKEALNLSLNIPAIDLNTKLNTDLYDLLSLILPKALKRDKSYYGQSIVLGGASLSLFDLVKVYGVLANQGITLDSKQSIITRQASYLISNILSENFKGNLSSHWQSKKISSKFAFKTGTSANRRDLWTLAYNNRFIVGVWFGDFRGRKTKNTSGLSISSEVSFEIISKLVQKYGQYPFIKPKGIFKSKVCQDSIFRFQNNCKQKVEDNLISIKNNQCKLLSIEKLIYLQQNNLTKSIQNSNCLDSFKNHPPKILSPLNNTHIIKSKLVLEKYQKTLLKCISTKSESKIYWFLNSKLIAQSISGIDLFYTLANGKHTITCLDENSIKSEVFVEVE